MAHAQPQYLSRTVCTVSGCGCYYDANTRVGKGRIWFEFVAPDRDPPFSPPGFLPMVSRGHREEAAGRGPPLHITCTCLKLSTATSSAVFGDENGGLERHFGHSHEPPGCGYDRQ
jgi:hypothetical protein